MEVLARHSGAQDGVGQVDWSAYLRNVFLINHGHPPDYKRAAQYALWAEDQEIYVSDEFPISSLHRFFTADNLALLGFRIDKVTDDLAPAISAVQVKQMAQILMTDFFTGRQGRRRAYSNTGSGLYQDRAEPSGIDGRSRRPAILLGRQVPVRRTETLAVPRHRRLRRRSQGRPLRLAVRLPRARPGLQAPAPLPHLQLRPVSAIGCSAGLPPEF